MFVLVVCIILGCFSKHYSNNVICSLAIVIYLLCDAVQCRVSAAVVCVAGLLKGNFRISQDSHPVIECRVLPHKWIVCASWPFCSYVSESQLWVTHNLYVFRMEALAAYIEMLVMVRRQYWYLCAIHTPTTLGILATSPKSCIILMRFDCGREI